MPADLYTEFLRIPPGPRPPDHYTILSLPLFATNVAVIHEAVLRQTAELKRWAIHPDAATRDRVQVMLNEVNRAGFILEDARSKAAYDRELARQYGVSIADLDAATTRLAPAQPGGGPESPAAADIEAAPAESSAAPHPAADAQAAASEELAPSSSEQPDLMLPEPHDTDIELPPAGASSPAFPPSEGPALVVPPSGGSSLGVPPLGGLDAPARVSIGPIFETSPYPSAEERIADTPARASVGPILEAAPHPSAEGGMAFAESRVRPVSGPAPRRRGAHPVLKILAALAAVALAALVPALVLRKSLPDEPASKERTEFLPAKGAKDPGSTVIVDFGAGGWPEGAKFWLDGREKCKVQGSGRHGYLDFMPGQHVVKISAEGYETEERKITVEAGKTLSVPLVAGPLPQLAIRTLWAAARKGDQAAMARCFTPDALASMAETDRYIAQHKADLPDGLRGLTALARLTALATASDAGPEVAQGDLRADWATATVTWPWGFEKVSFVRTGEGWRIAPPVGSSDRLRSEAEEALDQSRTLAKRRVEAFWAAAAAGDRDALLGCFDGPARAEAIALDGQIEKQSQLLPALAEFRLLPGLARHWRQAKIEYGEPTLLGDKAKMWVTGGGKMEVFALSKDGSTWKIALPCPPLLSLAKQAEAKEKGAVDETRAAVIRAGTGQAQERDLPILLESLLRSTDAELWQAEVPLTAAAKNLKDPDRAAAPLVAALPGAGVGARCALLRVLSQIDGPRALEAVRAALKDDNGRIQDAAARALADWPNPNAAADLLALARSTQDEARHALALRGYLRLVALMADHTRGEKVTLYEGALAAARRLLEKELVLDAVAPLATPDAIRLVQRCLYDPVVGLEAARAELRIARSLIGSHRSEAMAAFEQLAGISTYPTVQREAQQELARLAPPPPPKRLAEVDMPKEARGLQDTYVVLRWDRPADLDLHVIEPNGDRCWFKTMSTPNGGTLDNDDTQGCGPESYGPGPRALPGTYRVFVSYFAARESPPRPITATVTVFRRFEGRRGEPVGSYRLTLANPNPQTSYPVLWVTLPGVYITGLGPAVTEVRESGYDQRLRKPAPPGQGLVKEPGWPQGPPKPTRSSPRAESARKNLESILNNYQKGAGRYEWVSGTPRSLASIDFSRVERTADGTSPGAAGAWLTLFLSDGSAVKLWGDQTVLGLVKRFVRDLQGQPVSPGPKGLDRAPGPLDGQP